MREIEASSRYTGSVRLAAVAVAQHVVSTFRSRHGGAGNAVCRSSANVETLESRRLLSYVWPVGGEPSPWSALEDRGPVQAVDLLGTHHAHDGNCGHDHHRGGWVDAESAETIYAGEGSAGSGDFSTTGGRWGSGTGATVSYSYNATILNGGLPGGLSNAAINDSIEEALSLWSAVSPLRFVQVTDSGPTPTSDDNDYPPGSTPNIRFGAHALSGTNGGTLAHGYYPPPNGQGGLAGDVHFDTLDQWGTIDDGTRFDMIEVATHEIGHAIGLLHPDQATPPQSVNAIMNSSYGARYSGPGTGFLFADDIAGVQSIYGTGLGYVLDMAGNLIVSGTETTNTFNIDVGATTTTVSSSEFGSFAIGTDSFNNLLLNTRGGNDHITVNGLRGDRSITVRGFAGDDIFRIGDNIGSVEDVNGTVTFIGGDGSNSLYYNDSLNGLNDTYSVNFSNITRTANGTVNYSNINFLRINAGAGNNTFNMNGFFSGGQVILDGRDGNDTFNIGGTDYDNNVNSPVTLIGGSGSDSVVFNDITDTLDDAYIFTGTGGTFAYSFHKSSETVGVTRFGNDIQNVTLLGSDGNNDTRFLGVSGYAPSLSFEVFGNGGNDTLRVGDGAFGIANNDADISFSGGSGSDTLIYNAQNVAGATYNFNSRTLTGGFTGTITAAAGTENFNLLHGSGSDTVNVNSIGSGLSLLVDAGGNDDTIMVGAGDYDTNIVGNLEVNAGSGVDTVIIADTADTQDDPYYVTSTGIFGTNTHVFTKSFNGATTFHNDLEKFIINANPYNNTFNMIGAGGLPPTLDLTVNAGAGDDVFNLGDGSTGLNFYDNRFFFNGGTGADVFNYNGQIMVPSTYGINGDDITGGFTGEIFNSSTETVNLNTGGGDDVVNVNALFSTVTLNVDTGAGDDFLNSGGMANNVGNVDGAINFTGGAGSDTLNYNDQANSFADSYTLTSGSATRNSSGVVNFTQIEAVNLRSGSGNNVINVNSTIAGPVLVDAGAGDDAINLNGKNIFAPPIIVEGGAGLDAVYTDVAIEFTGSQNLSALNIDDGGRATLTAGGSKIIETDALSINTTAGAFLDLTDNAMIVDYVGSSPIMALETLLTSGYAGGAWNGQGINTSLGNASSFAIGYAEASEVASGGTFLGQAVDSTAIVMRFTRYGDADLNGTVNFFDFLKLRANYNQTGLWTNGDFDYNGTVNFFDFLKLRANYNLSV